MVLGNLLCSEQGQPLLQKIAAPPAPPAAPTVWAAVGEWWSGSGGVDVEEERKLSRQAGEALRSALITGLTVHANPTVVHVCVELTNQIAFTVRTPPLYLCCTVLDQSGRVRGSNWFNTQPPTREPQ